MSFISYGETIAVVLHLLVQLAVVARALLRPHRQPASRIAWVVVILALPVVGVIPATARSLAYRTFFERHRTLTFLAQLMLTVLVFAAVAYCVQNLALL